MSRALCLDCRFHRLRPHRAGAWRDCAEHHVPANAPASYICRHFRPTYWAAQGYVRNWGDAAVMNYPNLEILRGQFSDGPDGATRVEFIVLAPYAARRPVVLFGFSRDAWGMY